MKIEITLQFDVPDDCDLDYPLKILKDRIKDFNYKRDFVQANFITAPERSILVKEERLEQLERTVSSIKELLNPNQNELSIEASSLLSSHYREARELNKDN